MAKQFSLIPPAGREDERGWKRAVIAVLSDSEPRRALLGNEARVDEII